jgi:integrase
VGHEGKDAEKAELFLQRRRLLVLTGARRCEISHLKWSEVRGEALVIPGDRTKSGKTFSITITPAIRSLMERRAIAAATCQAARSMLRSTSRRP